MHLQAFSQASLSVPMADFVLSTVKKDETLKVSKFPKQIFLFSFEPKNEKKILP